ncbi:DUF1553 domain-containing protein [Schlesneria paludicola]|uniref:DUF1553 domain-containing protein n=1 Tax=Schlesneria paludicola TaxID=360056 RepID=UPI00049280FC|nr:DUF1553 domain-containing protein [Schlesneria paludicola]
MRVRICLLFIFLTGADLIGADQIDYVRDIKPILSRRCHSCHGALKQENELRLDTAALTIKGGGSGAAILPGKPTESLLIQAVKGLNGVSKMPPEGEPLTAHEITLLERWIETGAIAPPDEVPSDPAKHWSYQTPRRPEVPVVNDSVWSANPIDAFVVEQQSQRGLHHSLPAVRNVLLRRVYLDLIGLPPSAAELQAFLADSSPLAYENVVDRLLESPQYGERWGRHWMDVWRYSDWDGYGQEIRESKPHIWRWRDWIVESLNADKGYDQMIVEMLAGDEVAPDDPATLRATGYLVRNWYSFNRHVWLDASIEHTAKAFLGTTLNCARCHDHMYDPILQTDYYQFRAIFEAHDVRTDRVPGQSDLTKDGLVRVYDANAEAKTFLFRRGDDKQPNTEHPLVAGLPGVFRTQEFRPQPVTLNPTAFYPGLRSYEQEESLQQAQALLDTALKRRADEDAKLQTAKKLLSEQLAAKSNGEAVKVEDEASLQSSVAASEQTLQRAELSLETAIANEVWVQTRIQADRAAYAAVPPANLAALVRTASLAERTYQLRQSEQKVHEAEQQLLVAKRTPDKPDPIAKAEQALDAANKARVAIMETVQKPADSYTKFGTVYPATSTGRRLALARWITDPANPLTPRVAINHIWLRHFGAPLVPTVFDFGLNGKPPTHPELLDWLSTELVRQGWKTKAIHRLIVTSQTYRQQSQVGADDASNLALDADNLYLWRANSHRMEAEAIRDATLCASGRLDLTRGGPELDENAGMDVPRRSLYFRNSKEKKMTFLDTFDRPNVVDCYRRTESIIPQQALALANSSLLYAESRRLAGVLSQRVGSDDQPGTTKQFILAAYQQILSRDPSESELQECDAFLTAQTERYRHPDGLQKFPTGTANSVAPSEIPHQRARENLVHVLFNHNDFIHVR